MLGEFPFSLCIALNIKIDLQYSPSGGTLVSCFFLKKIKVFNCEFLCTVFTLCLLYVNQTLENIFKILLKWIHCSFPIVGVVVFLPHLASSDPGKSLTLLCVPCFTPQSARVKLVSWNKRVRNRIVLAECWLCEIWTNCKNLYKAKQPFSHSKLTVTLKMRF